MKSIPKRGYFGGGGITFLQEGVKKHTGSVPNTSALMSFQTIEKPSLDNWQDFSSAQRIQNNNTSFEKKRLNSCSGTLYFRLAPFRTIRTATFFGTA